MSSAYFKDLVFQREKSPLKSVLLNICVESHAVKALLGKVLNYDVELNESGKGISSQGGGATLSSASISIFSASCTD